MVLSGYRRWTQNLTNVLKVLKDNLKYKIQKLIGFSCVKREILNFDYFAPRYMPPL